MDLHSLWRGIFHLFFVDPTGWRGRRRLPPDFGLGSVFQPSLQTEVTLVRRRNPASDLRAFCLQVLELFRRHHLSSLPGARRFLERRFSSNRNFVLHFRIHLLRRGSLQRNRPGRHFADYLAFILFFPTMVAGPIKRYQDFQPKLRHPSAQWPLDWQRGITRILCGLVKKFAIADLLSAVTANLNHDAIALADRRILPLWLLAYGIKIYIDFSAYSDIAIGSARLFGIRVPENFDWPYLRINIAEFWSHWHMSLYRWLIDYIFIPLGGSRVAPGRVYINVLITMMISGLWHGAGLNFLVWGLWHGLLLCGHRLWRTMCPPPENPTRLRIGLSWALTFVLVNLGWAFFCMDLPTSIFFFRRLIFG
jgi:D-alanyl-lipoteichoic acid acyltransferase DltB (MBOAT superfamily)